MGAAKMRHMRWRIQRSSSMPSVGLQKPLSENQRMDNRLYNHRYVMTDISEDDFVVFTWLALLLIAVLLVLSRWWR